MRSLQIRTGTKSTLLAALMAISLIQAEARQYVLIRRVYAGEEGRAMLEKDESSRLFGWPLGVSSEVALLDSAPIFRAVVEKDSADSSNNEVVSPDGAEVARGTPLQDGRGAPRHIKDSSAETQRSEVSTAEKTEGRVKVESTDSNTDSEASPKQPKIIDIHNHEPDTAESHKANSTRDTEAGPHDKSPSKVIESSESTSADDEEELESINIEDIEKIMARHKIRIMGPTHPMAKFELDQDQAESVADEQHRAVPSATENHSERLTSPGTKKKKGAVPEQVMRIAEWLLNQTP